MNKLFFTIKKNCSKSYYPKNYIDKMINKKMTICNFLTMTVFFLFLGNCIVKKYILAMIFLALGYLINGIYFIDLTRYYHKMIYEQENNSIILSNMDKDKTLKNIKVVSELCLIFTVGFLGVFILFACNNSIIVDYKSVMIFMTFFEVICISVFTSYSNFIVVFKDNFFFSTCYTVYYDDIKEIELIKKIPTSEGELYHCIIYYYNGEKSVDKFFKDEFDFLSQKAASQISNR